MRTIHAAWLLSFVSYIGFGSLINFLLKRPKQSIFRPIVVVGLMLDEMRMVACAAYTHLLGD